MEETEVVELNGPAKSPWRKKRVNERANLLWTYLNLHADVELRFTQAELCGILGVGINGDAFREAVFELEHRGWLSVNRTRKPHRYTPIH